MLSYVCIGVYFYHNLKPKTTIYFIHSIQFFAWFIDFTTNCYHIAVEIFNMKQTFCGKTENEKKIMLKKTNFVTIKRHFQNTKLFRQNLNSKRVYFLIPFNLKHCIQWKSAIKSVYAVQYIYIHCTHIQLHINTMWNLWKYDWLVGTETERQQENGEREFRVKIVMWIAARVYWLTKSNFANITIEIISEIDFSSIMLVSYFVKIT